MMLLHVTFVRRQVHRLFSATQRAREANHRHLTVHHRTVLTLPSLTAAPAAVSGTKHPAANVLP
jgi:hypothetical protein